MNETFSLQIVTLQKAWERMEIRRANILLKTGYYTVMAGHEKFVGFMKAHTAEIRDADNEPAYLSVSDGIAEMDGDRLLLLVQRAEECSVPRPQGRLKAAGSRRSAER